MTAILSASVSYAHIITKLLKHRSEGAFRSVKAKVSNKNIFHSSLLSEICRAANAGRIPGLCRTIREADFDAGHFHVVADLKILHVVEEGVDVFAVPERLKGAHPFQKDRGGQHGQGNEQSKAGFKGVFHTLSCFVLREIHVA